MHYTAVLNARQSEMATLMDYFSHIVASFTSTECGKKMVKWVKRPVGRPRKHPLELIGAG